MTERQRVNRSELNILLSCIEKDEEHGLEKGDMLHRKFVTDVRMIECNDSLPMKRTVNQNSMSPVSLEKCPVYNSTL